MSRWDQQRARRKGGPTPPDRRCLGCGKDARPRVAYCSDQCRDRNLANLRKQRQTATTDQENL